MTEITKNFHVHMSITTTDCDGRFDRDYVSLPNEGEDDYDFKSRVLHSMVSWSSSNKVEFSDADDQFAARITVSYAHDEGGYHGEAEFCVGECSDLPERQRDHFAEQMGY